MFNLLSTLAATVTCAAAAVLLTIPGCCSTSQHNELAALRAENQALRATLQTETGKQMREILAVAITHYLDVHDRLPMRHSDMRDILGEDGWINFLALYDRTDEVVNRIAKMDDPWAWIDEHGSFQWLQGEAFDHFSPVFIERGEVVGWPRWVVFGDCHAELIAFGGTEWHERGLP